MATGHACVVRNIPAMEEILSREAGIFCDDVQEMVEAVRALVSDSSRRFELQMRAKICAREFSWAKSAHILLSVYNKVIGCGDESG